MADVIGQRRYKATLILAPSQGLGVWKGEQQAFFPMLRLKQYYSSAARATFQERQSIIGTSIVNLLESLERLPDGPTALSVVVLSSYLTWSKRSMWWERKRVVVNWKWVWCCICANGADPSRPWSMRLSGDVSGWKCRGIVYAEQVVRKPNAMPGRIQDVEGTRWSLAMASPMRRNGM